MPFQCAILPQRAIRVWQSQVHSSPFDKICGDHLNLRREIKKQMISNECRNIKKKGETGPAGIWDDPSAEIIPNGAGVCLNGACENVLSHI